MTAAAGMAITEAAAMMTIEATVGGMTVAEGTVTMIAAISMGEAAAAKPLNKKRRMKRRFFCA